MDDPKKRAAQMEAELLKKKRKKEKLESGEWDRCMYKIVRKNRFCNIERVKGSIFCGNHLPNDEAVVSKKSQKFKANLRRRVPCPIDGTHTVYEYDLDKHILICNKVKEAEAMKKLPYYSKNINSGSHDGFPSEVQTSVDTTTMTPTVQESSNTDGTDQNDEAIANEHTSLTAQQEQGLIARLQSIDFGDLCKRIHTAYDACVGEIQLHKLHHPCCEEFLAEKRAAGASKSLLRHIDQQASILGHMDRVKLLKPTSTFVELGAGRGMLSLALAQTFKDSSFVLIDRAHTRGKADHFIDELNEEKKGKTLRAKIDIRHLNFAGMDAIADKPVVCMSKHLCGVATDLSLRAITQTLPGKPEGEDQRVSSLFQGLAVALCCHHVCTWEDYVNPEFFVTQGFQPHEFPLVTSMTSWATCGMGLEGDAVEHLLGISKSDRAILGRKCKRILDAGRAAYLESFHLKTQLIHYCDLDDSLENCLLLSWT